VLTNGSNGIPADYPTRVVREDPEREGLLYAGTEFGAFISFDNGVRWQPLQLNLPITPITDMKVWRGDLVLSTQGRAFWILDDIVPLRQMSARVSSQQTYLFKPRDAYRFRYSATLGGEESTRQSTSDPQYPPRGAMIDYWLPANTTGPVTLDVLTPSGTIVRSYSSEMRAPPEASPDLSPPNMASVGTPRISKNAGLNRAIWDLAYPGPWDTLARRSGRDGPVVAPGTFTVRLSANGVVQTQPLIVRADPRAIRDGITSDILREQLAHNLRVRDLTSQVNIAAAEVSAISKRGGEAASLPRLRAVQQLLLTPPVRYSQPGLQAHIQYLYGAATSADQKVGRDAQLRYVELKQQFESVLKEIRDIVRTK
jgi:hypothetical protein